MPILDYCRLRQTYFGVKITALTSEEVSDPDRLSLGAVNNFVSREFNLEMYNLKQHFSFHIILIEPHARGSSNVVLLKTL